MHDKILCYIKDGKFKINEIDTNLISTNEIKISNLDFINQNDKIIKKMGNFDSEINMFICYGQSWAQGYDTTAITLEQRYDNIMLDFGIKVNPLNDLTQIAQSFVPMVEFTGRGGNQYVGETPVSAQSNMVKQLIESENGYKYTDFEYKILGTSPGYGSQTLYQLSKGVGTGWYERLISQVQMAYDIAKSMNKKLVVQAFSWAQGELGSQLSGTYAENLEILRRNIDTDVKQITHQTQTVKCITWQAFLYTANKAKDFYDRYVGASEQYENIICSGATYHLDNVRSENLHFTAISQDWLGGYFGIAYKRAIIDQQKFIPLKPKSIIIDGADLYLKLFVPVEPICIDTDRVAEAENYGFDLYDSNNVNKTILNVKIFSPDTLKITCDTDINSTDILTYAQNAGSTYNRTTGNRGNIRDSQGDTIIYETYDGTKLPMHNWLVVFSKTLSELEVQ